MDDVTVRCGYVPGAVGRVVELHGAHYAARWGFGAFFEAKVARDLAEFVGRYDAVRDGFWTASAAGRVEGSITIDGLHADGEGAHLYEQAGFRLVEAHRGRQWGTEVTEQRFELDLAGSG